MFMYAHHYTIEIVADTCKAMYIFCLVNPLPTGQFCMFLSSANFFKFNFHEKFFQEYHQSFKQFGSR